jgi:2'-5' RNA ligase
MTDAPLVVTLGVDRAAQTAWDALRRRWFPPGRLVVGAHLTLFHALPGEHADAVVAACADVAGRTRPFPVTVNGPRSLGRGVALTVTSPALLALHATLRGRWSAWLTPQDAQRFSPHVTVQNKVSPATAAATLEAVRAGFGPAAATATGLEVWRYLGGPWEALASRPFGR